jgi:hypothetical protein
MPQAEFVPRPHVCCKHVASSRPIPEKDFSKKIPEKANPVASDLQKYKV